ncbi:MAG: hypothetical protein DWQ02_11165, partial [Bacteroidetes bacterium]
MKTRVSLLFTLLLSIIHSSVFSQIQIRPVNEQESHGLTCGNHVIWEKEKQLNSKKFLDQQKLDSLIYQFLVSRNGNDLPLEKTTRTIPVVVHITHNNGPENSSDAQVIAGIEQLNDAFANIKYYDQGSGV